MPLNRFAEHCVALRDAALPAAVVHAAKRCVVDWFAATVPGGAAAPATLLVAALAEDLADGRAMLLPSGRRTTARMAALINGAAAHTLEVDDIYRDALTHPGAPVIAAALAAAQARRVDGAGFLRGVVAGYEVATRIGVAVNPAHYEYWHPTGTVGTLGAAAAAATVLGLDRAATHHAMANAATLAAGLQQAFRSDAMGKPLHAARAAETGVLTALAAEAGVTGAEAMLDGARGFGAAMSRDPDWQRAVADLGTRYNILDTTQKAHAACGHIHAAIDAVIRLRERHRLTPENVVRIVAGTYAKALEVTGNDRPRTAFEGKFSLPYCLAVALTDGRVRLGAFAPERLADPALRALMARVEARVDDAAEAAFPRARAAVVEIETTDGRRLGERAHTRKGDPDDPLSDAELDDKYRELVAPRIDAAAAARLLDCLWRLDRLDDMAELPFPRAKSEAPGADDQEAFSACGQVSQ